jgi:hypothetical protein
MSEETHHVIVLVPILNFDCAENSVKIDETLLVRRAHTDEIENMIKQFPNYKMLKSALGDTKFVIEKRGSSDEISNTYFSPETADAQRIESAFRLLAY